MNYKTITHWFAAGIALLAGFAVTPAGQALVAQYPKLSGVFAGVAALAALYHSPKVTAMLLIALLCCGAGMAQTAVPPQHFTLSGSVVSYMGPGGTAPASIADGYFNLTQHLSVGYQQIVIPSIATAKLGVLDYGKPSCSWLGKTLSAKLVFNCSKVQIDVFGGAGKLNESSLGVNRIAETAGVCVSYTLGANVSANLVCGQWLHGGIVNGLVTNGGLPVAPNSSSAAISSGLKVHF